MEIILLILGLFVAYILIKLVAGFIGGCVAVLTFIWVLATKGPSAFDHVWEDQPPK